MRGHAQSGSRKLNRHWQSGGVSGININDNGKKWSAVYNLNEQRLWFLGDSKETAVGGTIYDVIKNGSLEQAPSQPPYRLIRADNIPLIWYFGLAMVKVPKEIADSKIYMEFPRFGAQRKYQNEGSTIIRTTTYRTEVEAIDESAVDTDGTIYMEPGTVRWFKCTAGINDPSADPTSVWVRWSSCHIYGVPKFTVDGVTGPWIFKPQLLTEEQYNDKYSKSTSQNR